MNKIKIIQNIVSNLRAITDNVEALVEALKENQGESVAPEKTTAKLKEESKVNKPAEEAKTIEKAPEVKQPTLEEVRAAMAEKSRNGHREEVKAIIIKHGANKLTTLNSEQYVEVMKEVGEIK